MTLNEYVTFFNDSIRNDSLVIFHNADLYPNEFKEVRTVSYRKTRKPVTIKERLKPLDKNYRMERFAMWMISEAPFGKWIRRQWGDPFYFDQEQVKWRNYEASFDANELEPTSRKNATYVLQEYFVPVDQLTNFVPRMAALFKRHQVNVINVSIRHARQDPGTLDGDGHARMYFQSLYSYKQRTREDDRQNVSTWTKELIDEALARGGSYYLPYQIHATPQQFQQAYPLAEQFFALKQKLDPTGKFSNRLWERYYASGCASTGRPGRATKINYYIPAVKTLP